MMYLILPPSSCEQTDACENITIPKLHFWAVNILDILTDLDSFNSFEHHQLPVDYVLGQCLPVNLAHRLCNSVKNWLGLGVCVCVCVCVHVSLHAFLYFFPSRCKPMVSFNFITNRTLLLFAPGLMASYSYQTEVHTNSVD